MLSQKQKDIFLISQEKIIAFSETLWSESYFLREKRISHAFSETKENLPAFSETKRNLFAFWISFYKDFIEIFLKISRMRLLSSRSADRKRPNSSQDIALKFTQRGEEGKMSGVQVRCSIENNCHLAKSSDN